jgi:5-methylthioadenosine/S-adenosylhomocysteine deaminase
MLAEMRLCANLHRQPGFETAAPGAEEVLAMATIAGAHAAGFGDTIGRIVPGAAADLVLLRHERITSPFLAPQMPRIDALLQVASARDVETVIIGGEVVYHAGAWRGFDRAKVEAELVQEAVASLPRRDESAELFVRSRPIGDGSRSDCSKSRPTTVTTQLSSDRNLPCLAGLH